MTDTRKPAVASSRAYADNYRILHDVAERLRNGGPDDVDGLVADFRRAMEAYRFCQERLDAIRADIDRTPSLDTIDPIQIESFRYTSLCFRSPSERKEA